MRFGIFYEHQLPRPWDAESERRLLDEALEQVELADRLGIDAVWAVEHHFLEEYSHSSASDVFLAAASQRTRRIRLGFGIVPLPAPYNHPARVAETAATLDLVSGGRVELGTGETSSGIELEGFGVDRATKREQWHEALDVVARMMVEEPFAGSDGRFLALPARNVVPKPLQRPHPPLWVACSRRETIRMAAERGLGALSFAFVEPDQAREWVREYRETIASERCVPAGFAVNPRVAVVLPMMLHRDADEARARGLEGAHFFGYALAHYYALGAHRPGRTDLWAEFLARRDELGLGAAAGDGGTPKGADDGNAAEAVERLRAGLDAVNGAIGSPAQLLELCRRYEEAGVDQVVFALQIGRTRHEHICEALELFAAEVLPHFAASADAADAARDAQLAGAIAAALARREPPREPPPDLVVAPTASGPAAAPRRSPRAGAGRLGGTLRTRRRRLAGRARKALRGRAERVLAAFVRRSGDGAIERTLGSDRGLALLFGAMARAYVPERAQGFDGDVRYELRRGDGRVATWTVTIAPARASAAPRATLDPRLTLRVGVADFVRLAARELDPGKALLSGRLELVGDFVVALSLAEMFGSGDDR